MKKILILSGKGGTGKTTVASAFIGFGNILAFADCDVDAPNLHLVQHFKKSPQESDFIGSSKAYIDPVQCNSCGLCAKHCRFQGVKQVGNHYEIDEYACEGCGVCELLCKENAIQMKDDLAGKLKLYQEEQCFSTAKLKMGRGNSGKLVAEVKQQLKKHAGETPLAIIDGSPGIGCPVISSINGVDFVLIVAEASLSGISDLKRIMNTVHNFQIRAAVCINKYDNCLEQSQQLEQWCKSHEIPVLGKIPFDLEVSKAINQGMDISQIECPASKAILSIYKNIVTILNTNK